MYFFFSENVARRRRLAAGLKGEPPKKTLCLIDGNTTPIQYTRASDNPDCIKGEMRLGIGVKCGVDDVVYPEIGPLIVEYAA